MGWRQARDVSSHGPRNPEAPQLPPIPALEYLATIHGVDQRTVLEAAMRQGKNAHQCMSGKPVDIDELIRLLRTCPKDLRSNLCLDWVQGVDFTSLHNSGEAASIADMLLPSVPRRASRHKSDKTASISEKSSPADPRRASVAFSHMSSGNATNPSAWSPMHGVQVLTVQPASGGLDGQQGHGASSRPLTFATPIQRQASAATSSLGLPQFGARMYPARHPTPRTAPRSVTPCSVTPRSAIIW